MGRDGWERVNRHSPCPVCGKSDWCGYCGDIVHCMRIESDRPGKTGGWFHRHPDKAGPIMESPKIEPKTDAEYAAIWEPQVRRKFLNQIDSIIRLAAILGVSRDSLDMLRVGYDNRERCWWFGERNEHGRYIGVTRRFEDGKKMCAIGSKRGLTYIDDWCDWPGPLYIVEGASDVAAGLTIGLCVVGRPSNVGGVEYLTGLLCEFPREIVVLGERDRREHGDLAESMQVGHDEDCMGCHRCWPGLYGAELTAAALRKRLERDVSFTFPPGRSKDLRTWLNDSTADDLLAAWKTECE